MVRLRANETKTDESKIDYCYERRVFIEYRIHVLCTLHLYIYHEDGAGRGRGREASYRRGNKDKKKRKKWRTGGQTDGRGRVGG